MAFRTGKTNACSVWFAAERLGLPQGDGLFFSRGWERVRTLAISLRMFLDGVSVSCASALCSNCCLYLRSQSDLRYQSRTPTLARWLCLYPTSGECGS